MGWFSPIKGHYPSLGQIDKTLPVKAGNTGIERGMVIEVTTGTNKDGEFKIAASATAENVSLLFISLQDYKDAQAGMAGTTGFDGNVPQITEGNITIPAVDAGAPTITGLALSMEGEYETDQYTGLDGKPVGTPLTVANGQFVEASGNDAVVVAYLTSGPYSRWVNNATQKQQGAQVTRQGKNVSVIRFITK
jgi:hypothetical protein